MMCKARDFWIVWALCFGDLSEMTALEFMAQNKRRAS